MQGCQKNPLFLFTIDCFEKIIYNFKVSICNILSGGGKNVKKTYVAPELDLLLLHTADILTESDGKATGMGPATDEPEWDIG